MTNHIKRLFGFGPLTEVELLAATNRDDLSLIVHRRNEAEQYDMLRDGDRFTAETLEQLGEVRRLDAKDLKAEGGRRGWLR
jgi:hypothetical protein